MSLMAKHYWGGGVMIFMVLLDPRLGTDHVLAGVANLRGSMGYRLPLSVW